MASRIPTARLALACLLTRPGGSAARTWARGVLADPAGAGAELDGTVATRLPAVEAGLAACANVDATRAVLTEWTERLRRETGDAFPENVTAFRPGMAVHGRFREPCPDCGAPVQRIVYAENETNYCARCQTGGKLLADRALSRLLRGDWPRTLEEMEEGQTPR